MKTLDLDRRIIEDFKEDVPSPLKGREISFSYVTHESYIFNYLIRTATTLDD
jgi:hypothetical protein